ncbi:Hypothetical predicted protein [Cloeon dipterum]|nr:Hypothetical predicted protein [Cloeon dipterum]
MDLGQRFPSMTFGTVGGYPRRELEFPDNFGQLPSFLKPERRIWYSARLSAVPADVPASQEQDNTREQQPAMYDDSGVALEQTTGRSSCSSSLQGTPPGLSDAAAGGREATCSTPVEQEQEQESMEAEESSEPERPASTGKRSPSPEIYRPHLRCPLCGATNFAYILELFLHFTEYHRDDQMNAPHLNCSVCTMACLSKESLAIHTVTHMAQGGRCLLCVFKSEDSEKMDNHRVDFHHLPSTLNKKGKKQQSMLKCKAKQCTFQTTEKYTMWIHFRDHVREGKMLKCNYCPFATALKHHLEFHHDGHLGKKREQCPDCGYKCTNKAMLKSHMKRHSDWCDYKCADCNFEAKYHNILKNHLRAKNHQQKMVIRPDGTQVPTVDVNGRRRGPRSKSGAAAVPDRFPLPPVTNNAQLLPIYQIRCRNCDLPFTSEVELQQHMVSTHSDIYTMTHIMPIIYLAIEQQKQLRLAAARLGQTSPVPINLSTKPATPPVAVPEQAASSGEECHPDIGHLTIKEHPVPTRVRWHCEHCNVDFKSSNEYAFHMGHHGTPDPFTCRLCEVKTKTREDFHFHVTMTTHD